MNNYGHTNTCNMLINLGKLYQRAKPTSAHICRSMKLEHVHTLTMACKSHNQHQSIDTQHFVLTHKQVNTLV